MAQRTSFDKLQRDRAKKAKAAAKRDKRLNGPGDADTEVAAEVGDGPPAANHYSPNLTHAEILERIEDIHRRFDAGTMSYDDFEEHKAELFGRLTVD